MHDYFWTEWAGGDVPVSDDVTVWVRLRSGSEHRVPVPSAMRWSHGPNYSFDIVAYRVERPPTTEAPDPDAVPALDWARLFLHGLERAP